MRAMRWRAGQREAKWRARQVTNDRIGVIQPTVGMQLAPHPWSGRKRGEVAAYRPNLRGWCRGTHQLYRSSGCSLAGVAGRDPGGARALAGSELSKWLARVRARRRKRTPPLFWCARRLDIAGARPSEPALRRRDSRRSDQNLSDWATGGLEQTRSRFTPRELSSIAVRDGAYPNRARSVLHAR